jgi:uncharacterized protein YndB with AHSA1/START domain
MTEQSLATGDTQREIVSVRTAEGEARMLRIRRRYNASVEDVWEACTTPDRLKRFFLPISGDLRVGGRFQFQGNAGGEILRCEPPRQLRITWEYGQGPASEVDLRLTSDAAGGTVLQLEHSPVPQVVEMDGRKLDPILNDPLTGMWGMGTGWEMGLIALGKYLRGEMPDVSKRSFELTPEILEMVAQCGEGWAAAVTASRPGTDA